MRNTTDAQRLVVKVVITMFEFDEVRVEGEHFVKALVIMCVCRFCTKKLCLLSLSICL